jgi:uncharacterized protein YbcV (DUF1398 family)
MNTGTVHEALGGSLAGKLTFPQVVGMLVGAGVESYFADLVRGQETFYAADGETHAEKMALALTRVADDFSETGIIAAIRAAQADQIRYPEFVKRATAAGVAAYWAFLAGRRVIYFGRKGEFHIEEFPPAKT